MVAAHAHGTEGIKRAIKGGVTTIEHGTFAASIGPVSQKNFDRGYKAGVNIVFGTDCVVCPHGSNAKEFLYMVEGR